MYVAFRGVIERLDFDDVKGHEKKHWITCQLLSLGDMMYKTIGSIYGIIGISTYYVPSKSEKCRQIGTYPSHIPSYGK